MIRTCDLLHLFALNAALSETDAQQQIVEAVVGAEAI
jgi:hypothetical protein